MYGSLEQQLNILCGWHEDARPHLMTPWRENGFSFSTNGHCLLRVPGEYGRDGSEERFPKLECFPFDALDASNGCTYVDQARLKAFRISHPCKNCRVENDYDIFVMCKECRGTGSSECFHCGSEIECEACDGYGEWPVYARSRCTCCHGTGIKVGPKLRIRDRFYNVQTLLFLHAHLPNLRFLQDVDCGSSKMIGFKFGEYGSGFLMEMSE